MTYLDVIMTPVLFKMLVLLYLNWVLLNDSIIICSISINGTGKFINFIIS